MDNEARTRRPRSHRRGSGSEVISGALGGRGRQASDVPGSSRVGGAPRIGVNPVDKTVVKGAWSGAKRVIGEFDRNRIAGSASTARRVETPSPRGCPFNGHGGRGGHLLNHVHANARRDCHGHNAGG